MGFKLVNVRYPNVDEKLLKSWLQSNVQPKQIVSEITSGMQLSVFYILRGEFLKMTLHLHQSWAGKNQQ